MRRDSRTGFWAIPVFSDQEYEEAPAKDIEK